MAVPKFIKSKKFLIFLVAALILLGLEWSAAAASDSPSSATDFNCIMCHQYDKFKGYTRDSLQVSLTVNKEGFSQSVHGQAGVACVGCHTTITKYPHSNLEQVTCAQCHEEKANVLASLPYDTGRAMVVQLNETCRNCHAAEFTAESMHTPVEKDGQINTPLCTDCHGGHEVQHPNDPPSRIIPTCSRCHTVVYQDFLAKRHNSGDPTSQTCADCHVPHKVGATPAQPTETPQPVPTEASSGTTYLSMWNGTCTMCHAYQNLLGKAQDSSIISLTVKEQEISNSVHGKAGLGCAACHPTITGYPHSDVEQVACSTCHSSANPELKITANLPFQNTRAVTIQLNDACRTCHQNEYETSADSMHSKSFKNGNLQAPLCVDCHGSHDVQSTKGSRASISKECGNCHKSVYTSYQASVHGVAVEKNGSLDAPTCLDCHGQHAVRGPSQAGFRKESVATCARCHEDQEMMSKYGISAQIFRPNMDSFHGTPLSLFSQQGPDQAGGNPVCFDCHGIHTILKTDDPSSSVFPTNLLGTCQKCHPDATSRFASFRLLGHVRSSAGGGLSLQYGIERIYAILIFAVIALLILYILLDSRKRWAGKKQLSQPVNIEE